MVRVSNEEFQQLIAEALATLPQEHVKHLQNVALLYEDEPTPRQREELRLRCNETLFGLYEGVPLSKRMGADRMIPDRITLFKDPMCERANTIAELREQIRHTLWHEIAHYYGLDHQRIHELEGKKQGRRDQ